MRAYFYQTVASTQDLAKTYLKKGGLEAACFSAKQQTGGYGKRGRYFYSPAGQGLYLSLALPHFRANQGKINLLTPAIATAVVAELKPFYPDCSFALKWVNDIYLEGKKIAGILTEQVAAGLVVGLGLNLNINAFPPELRAKADSLHDPDFKQKNLGQKMMTAILRASRNYQTGEFLPKYRSLSLLINKKVRLKLGRKNICGQVLDIDQLGRLVLRHEGRVDHFSSGEVIKVHCLLKQ